MTIIKKLRTQKGLTQKMLAQKTTLSLRTIQRLESENQKPKGFTLNSLAKVFDLTPDELISQYHPAKSKANASKQHIRWINFSALACIIVPFGSVIFPTWLWSKFIDQYLVKSVGRKMVNFQIIWTVLMCVSLCIAPFIDSAKSDPLILWVLLAFMSVNLLIIFINAIKIQKNDFRIIHFGIELI